MFPTFWLDPESSKEVKAAPASLLTSFISLLAPQTRFAQTGNALGRSIPVARFTLTSRGQSLALGSLHQGLKNGFRTLGNLRQDLKNGFRALGSLHQDLKNGFRALGSLHQGLKNGFRTLGSLRQGLENGFRALGNLRQALKNGFRASAGERKASDRNGAAGSSAV